MTTLFNYKQPTSLGSLLDILLTRRLEARSRNFNASRKGKIAIFANDHIGIQINQYGIYDRISLELLFRFLDPIADELRSGIAFDVGANIGNHSLFFSRYVRCVHAFEPEPRTYQLLKFNSQTVDNIVTHPIGLGDTRGMFTLRENFENMGAASMAHADRGKPSVRVSVETLDMHPVDELVLVKIDVEGFESKVIRGGLETIRRAQPLIAFEQLATEFRRGKTETISLLEPLGYRFCWPEKQGANGSRISRRFNMLIDTFIHKRSSFQLVTAERVPERNHAMLIAVPERFQAKLGLN